MFPALYADAAHIEADSVFLPAALFHDLQDRLTIICQMHHHCASGPHGIPFQNRIGDSPVGFQCLVLQQTVGKVRKGKDRRIDDRNKGFYHLIPAAVRDTGVKLDILINMVAAAHIQALRLIT